MSRCQDVKMSGFGFVVGEMSIGVSVLIMRCQDVKMSRCQLKLKLQVFSRVSSALLNLSLENRPWGREKEERRKGKEKRRKEKGRREKKE